MANHLMLYGFSVELVEELRKTKKVVWMDVEIHRKSEKSQLSYGQLLKAVIPCRRPILTIDISVVDCVFQNIDEIAQGYVRHNGLSDMGWTDLLTLIYSHVLFFREFIEKQKIDLLIFSNIPHEGIDNVIHLVAKAMGIPSRFLFQTPFDAKHWVLSEVHDLTTLSSNAFAATKGNTSWESNAEISKSVNQSKIRAEFLDAMYGESVLWYMRGVYSSVSYSSSQPGKFIYFPLHLEPELTVSRLSGGGIFSSQITTIMALDAWCHKNDFHLVIKENPKQVRNRYRSELFYKLLASSRVKVVKKTVSTKELIQKSAGVVTISGTVGFEALCYGRRVVALGHTWWNHFPGVDRGIESLDLFLEGNLTQLSRANADMLLEALSSFAFAGYNDDEFRVEYMGPKEENDQLLLSSINQISDSL